MAQDIVTVIQEQNRIAKEIVGLIGQMLEVNRQWLNEQQRITEEVGQEFVKSRKEELEHRLSKHNHHPFTDGICICSDWKAELATLNS